MSEQPIAICSAPSLWAAVGHRYGARRVQVWRSMGRRYDSGGLLCGERRWLRAEEADAEVRGKHRTVGTGKMLRNRGTPATSVRVYVEEHIREGRRSGVHSTGAGVCMLRTIFVKAAEDSGLQTRVCAVARYRR